MDKVTIKKLNEVYIKVSCEPSIAMELNQHFTFEVPGAKFMPSYRNKIWDGNFRLYNLMTNTIYSGLLRYIEEFCKTRKYQVEYESDFSSAEFSLAEAEEFIKSLNLTITPRDYQMEAFVHAVRERRSLLLSPTACLDPETIIEVELNNTPVSIQLTQLEQLIKSGHSVKIDTPTGFERITDTYRKNSEGVKISFDDNSVIKCSNDHLIYLGDNWVPAKLLKVNDRIEAKTIISIDPLKKQDWIDFSIDADHESYYHNGILHHNSGKSLNIFLLVRYYKKKTLIIVPTTTLVHQLSSDFAEYGFDSDKYVHKIFAGQDKVTNKPVTISTWQSIYKMPKEFFNQFEVVIGDEAHNFKAKSLTSIMDKMVNCKYRFGFTGTIDGSQTNKLVLEGIFGPVRKVISTAELIEKKHLSEFKIKSIVLTYPDDIRKQLSTAKYQDELDYLVRLEARNKFICNLALSLSGVTLIMFQFVEKHGHILYEMINKVKGDKKVFYVHGGVDGEDRNRIRDLINKEKDCIIVASSGTFSTGINIPKIQNIIFASPSKSKIRNLQSIGRGLRKSSEKEISTLFDIADDLSWKTKKNYTLLHFVERVKIYNEEKFSYKIYKVALNV